MKSEHKKFILANRDKMSPEKISAALSIKRRSVKRFLDSLPASDSDAARPAEGIMDTPTPSPLDYRKILICLALIAIAGLIAYANVLGGEFIWDDYSLLVNNRYVTDAQYLPNIFSEDLGAGAGIEYNFYRPLHLVTYMVEYRLGGLNPVMYHLDNVLLHILAAFLVFGLSFTLFNNRTISFLSGLLFVVHPVHTQAVSYISGRADPLYLSLLLLGMILYIKGQPPGRKTLYPLALVCFALALLTKEVSLVFPLLVLLYHYVFRKKVYISKLLPILGIAAAFIVIRVVFLYDVLGAPHAPTTVLQRLPGFFAAIANYTRIVIAPFGLHPEYGRVLFDFSDPRVWAGIAIFSVLVFSVIKTSKTDRLVHFAILWMLITIFPYSNLFPLNAYMLEQWLYLPSFGIALLAASGINLMLNTRNLKHMGVLTVIFLVGYFSFLTHEQNKTWLNNVNFFKRTLSYVPDNFKLNVTFANTLANMGRFGEAGFYFDRARQVAINNRYARTYIEELLYKGAFAYQKSGELKMAIERLENLAEVNPNHVDGYELLARIYYATGQIDEAISTYKKAMELDPNDARTYNDLGALYYVKKNFKDARLLMEKSLEIDPNNEKAYFNLARLYYASGENDRAIGILEKGFKVISNDPQQQLFYRDSYGLLAALYLGKGEYSLAVQNADKAEALGAEIPPELSSKLEEHREVMEKLP